MAPMFTLLTIGLSSLTLMGHATPMPQVFPGGPAMMCKTGSNASYKIKSQEKIEGNPVTGSKVCHGDDGRLTS